MTLVSNSQNGPCKVVQYTQYTHSTFSYTLNSVTVFIYTYIHIEDHLHHLLELQQL